MRRPNGEFWRYDVHGKVLEHVKPDGTRTQLGADGVADPKMAVHDMEKGMVAVAAVSREKDGLPNVTDGMFQDASNILHELMTTEQTYVKELTWMTQTFCTGYPEGLDKET